MTIPAPPSTPQQLAELPHLDPARLRVLKQLESASGKPVLGPLFEQFIADSQKALALLAQALLDKIVSDAELHAHTLKGSSANVGASRMAALGQALELGVQTADAWHGAEALLGALRTELEEVARLVADGAVARVADAPVAP